MSTRVETPRLVIRTFEPRDAEAWIALVNDPEVKRFLPPTPAATTETFQKAIQQRHAMEHEIGYSMWAVDDQATGEGLVNLFGLEGLKKYAAGREWWRPLQGLSRRVGEGTAGVGSGCSRESCGGLSIRGPVVRHPCVAALRRHANLQMRSPTVKYMLLIIGSQDADPVTAEEDQGLMEAFMAYHKSVCDAGVMVDSNVLESFEIATSVQVDRAGERIITDGPFAETREYLGGYYILDLPDLDTAIDWAARCPGARAWRVEVRPIQEFGLS